MRTLETRFKLGLWGLEFCIGATAVVLAVKGFLDSFWATDQFVANGEFGVGYIAGWAAMVLGLILLIRSR